VPAKLKPQLPSTILPEQTAIPDVAPHHLHRPMPRLIHDRSLRRPRNRGTGGMARPKGMTCVLCWIESGTLSQLLYDTGNIDAAQPARLHLAVTIERTEQRPSGDTRDFQPRLNISDWTRLGI
jgi:hypothetical protein